MKWIYTYIHYIKSFQDLLLNDPAFESVYNRKNKIKIFWEKWVISKCPEQTFSGICDRPSKCVLTGIEHEKKKLWTFLSLRAIVTKDGYRF